MEYRDHYRDQHRELISGNSEGNYQKAITKQLPESNYQRQLPTSLRMSVSIPLSSGAFALALASFAALLAFAFAALALGPPLASFFSFTVGTA
jgi:hypothetical protein